MPTKKFEFICETVDNGIIILDENLTVHFWNSWLETRTNIKTDDIISKNIGDLFDVNEQVLKRKINTALTLNSSTFYNPKVNQYLLKIKLNKITSKVFKYMQQSVTITALEKHKGLVIVYVYDNTQICETNYKLEHTLKERELLLNTTMEGIFLFEDNRCVNCNETALKLLNYETKKDLSNKQLHSFIHLDYHCFLQDKDSSEPIEVLMIRKENKFFSALINIKDTVFDGKNFKILTVLDISDLKRKDKLLSEQSKMAAMGEMIGNIAHQWRQPLSTISTAASGIKLQKDYDILTDSMFNEAVEGIVRSAKHLSQTIDDFKNFLKGDKKETVFNIKENIKKNLKITEGMLKNENIKVHLDCEDQITVFNYPNELTQAFVNLLNNSKDAITQNIPKNEHRLIFINAYEENNIVYIEITDNALGIKNDILHKVFEPYFTTKHQNQGTGLGLYMAHQLINISMKGNITVSNKTFRHEHHTYTGASFLITLSK